MRVKGGEGKEGAGSAQNFPSRSRFSPFSHLFRCLSPFLAPPSLIRLLILAMMRELFLRSKEEGVTEGERDRRF